MPQDEQNDWPSFETVLRDVATSDGPTDGDSQTTQVIPEVGDVLVVDESADVATPEVGVIDYAHDANASKESAGNTSALSDLELLPAPLAPIDFDTSAVRALLEPREAPSSDTFDLDALAPLTPPSSIDLGPEVLDDPESVEAAPEEAAELEVFEPAIAEGPIDAVFEPESVFELAFDPEAYPVEPTSSTDTFDDVSTPILDEVEGIELPGAVEEPAAVFDDLGMAGEISLDGVPAFVDEDTTNDRFSLVDGASLDEMPSGAVFELDADTIDRVEPDFVTPSIDLFDLQDSSDSVEAERIETYGADLYNSELFDDSRGDQADDNFDSIATANAIEGELNELSDMTALEPDFDIDDSAADGVELFNLDNVVPIRPDANEPIETEPSSDWLNPLDSSAHEGPSPTRVSHTGWVSLEADQEPAVEAKQDPDPWAHMRPTEEPKAEGFWGKIFGGDERKRAKARRLAQKDAETDERTEEASGDVEHSFDSTCPNCGAECEVDLDDPIGRRVHVSCPSCDHMWNTPYIEANTG